MMMMSRHETTIDLRVEDGELRRTIATLVCDLRFNATSHNLVFSTIDLVLSKLVLRCDEIPSKEAQNLIVYAASSPVSNSAWPEECLNKSGHCEGGRNIFHDLVRRHISQRGTEITSAKLIVPAQDGFVLRNDVLRRRTLGCRLIELAVDTTAPRQQVQAFRPQIPSFSHILDSALGYAVLQDARPRRREIADLALALLEADLCARLAFPWILKSPLPRMELAVVEGRPHPSYSDAARGPLDAAAALGIDLVILDDEAHWLYSEMHNHRRKDFVICDISVDQQLPERIIQALEMRQKMPDGLVTFSDKHLAATAMAAQRLGIATYPAEAIQTCTDKSKMRLVLSPACLVMKIDMHSAFSLDALRRSAEISHCQYPFIVKPASGNSSEGVSIVRDDVQLLHAVDNLKAQYPDRTILIEQYIGGPEVDANIVLMDGKVLFHEINDDFPSTAEMPCHEASSCSFAEQSTIIPSKLPIDERAMLASDLAHILGNLGFQNGVFHLEARVNNSWMGYQDSNGAPELLPLIRDGSPYAFEQPSTFLIEINARTPGHQESIAVEYTYGVDYYALYMLLALNHRKEIEAFGNGHLPASGPGQLDEHIRALINPFPESMLNPTNLVFIPVTGGGVLKSVRRLPDNLMAYVVWHKIMLEIGTRIEDPQQSGKWPFIACFVVMADIAGPQGREVVRCIGEQVRRDFEYVVE